MLTPHRFRAKRQLWIYSGLALETSNRGEYCLGGGQLKRSKKVVAIGGLNNHKHDLKNIFKGAAIRAVAVDGPFRELYAAQVTKGIKPPMARLTLARKTAAVTLTIRKKKEDRQERLSTNKESYRVKRQRLDWKRDSRGLAGQTNHG